MSQEIRIMSVEAGRLDTRNLSEKVHEYLVNLIIEGSLAYGQQLNIRQIADTLGISTMPVREAIKRLEAEGVVVVNPRSNCLLRIPTRKSILDAVEMREIIELFCMRKAVEDARSEALVGMRQIVAQMNEAVRIGDDKQRLRSYIRLDWLFHAELCSLADNEYAAKFYRELNLHLNMSFIYGLGVPPKIDQTLRDHEEMLQAIEAHSAAKGVRLITDHLKRSRSNIVEGEAFRSLC